VLIAAGAQGVWQLLSARRVAGRALAIGLCACLVVEMWLVAPETPPMYSPSLERASNHTMKWLVEHANGTRVHVWESPNRSWGSDNITGPLGLEAVTSYVTSEHRDYLPNRFDPPNWRTFISDSYREPARFWGMLDTRYVVSSSPRADPGFHLATRVAACPLSVCQPGKSAGTYIYENEHWMPRAWRVPRAVALVGDGRATFEAALDLMHLPSFDPWKVVVIQVASAVQATDADLTFAVGQEIVGLKPWNTVEARAAFDSLLLGPPSETQASVEFRRNNSNGFEVRAPGKGWLVVSEKIALGRLPSVRVLRLPSVRVLGKLPSVGIRDQTRGFELPTRLCRGLGAELDATATVIVTFSLATDRAAYDPPKIYAAIKQARRAVVRRRSHAAACACDLSATTAA
jgi:hypothetical protein